MKGCRDRRSAPSLRSLKTFRQKFPVNGMLVFAHGFRTIEVLRRSETGLDPLHSAFSAPRERMLRPVRFTRTRALPSFVRAAPTPSAVRSEVA